MKTVGEILNLSTQFLVKNGIDRPRLQVELLLAHVLSVPRIELYMQADRPMEEKELEKLRGFLKERASHKPWQYIVGQVEFLGCLIDVCPDVLIPRQETEILTERVLKELPSESRTIWDVCCGSGCIGIAIKKKHPDCTVILSDLSEKALQVAKANADKNQVEIEFRQGNLLEPFQGSKADVVVCNPPYVSETEYGGLDLEVRQWEPKMALVGDPYEQLSKELRSFLNPDGRVYLEIGTGMGEKIKKTFSDWRAVEVTQDWAGHDRFVKLLT